MTHPQPASRKLRWFNTNSYKRTVPEWHFGTIHNQRTYNYTKWVDSYLICIDCSLKKVCIHIANNKIKSWRGIAQQPPLCNRVIIPELFLWLLNSTSVWLVLRSCAMFPKAQSGLWLDEGFTVQQGRQVELLRLKWHWVSPADRDHRWVVDLGQIELTFITQGCKIRWLGCSVCTEQTNWTIWWRLGSCARAWCVHELTRLTPQTKRGQHGANRRDKGRINSWKH